MQLQVVTPELSPLRFRHGTSTLQAPEKPFARHEPVSKALTQMHKEETPIERVISLI